MQTGAPERLHTRAERRLPASSHRRPEGATPCLAPHAPGQHQPWPCFQWTCDSIVTRVPACCGGSLQLGRCWSQAMLATAHLHSATEAATRILPAVAPLAVDSVAEVRHTALQAMASFSQVLNDHSRMLDDQAAMASEPDRPIPIPGGGSPAHPAAKCVCLEQATRQKTCHKSRAEEAGLQGWAVPWVGPFPPLHP